MCRSRYVPSCIEIESEEGSLQLTEGITESERTKMDCPMFDIDERGSFSDQREKLHSVTKREVINQNASENHNVRVNNNFNDSEITVSSSDTLEVSLGCIMTANTGLNKICSSLKKKTDKGPIRDIRNLASQGLMNQI